MKKGKVIVISAPSGTGKSTIINAILDKGDIDLHFSVSATNRAPRQGETDGINYYFMTTDSFRDAISAGEFIEWEEVYPGRFYGTLRREVDRLLDEGHNVILDIDVKGALSVKNIYADNAVTVFIEPPSLEHLRQRLTARASDSASAIDERLDKAGYELSFAPQFDRRIVNDDLDTAVRQTHDIIDSFVTN